ncbi:hypothetical protein GGR52DRAFT_571450 [Hypoxylon sp. FL1284]|nr:hypothetical protein GGR52DRAFT_571450 [Hypoxylon sp. FL1284]
MEELEELSLLFYEELTNDKFEHIVKPCLEFGTLAESEIQPLISVFPIMVLLAGRTRRHSTNYSRSDEDAVMTFDFLRDEDARPLATAGL